MRLVFVSSTFKDMQFERDELNIRLAPRINDFLAKYGESVRFGDLRWGVNTSKLESEESSKKVLKVCLDEIDNAKPYMIVFIGERYGWIPSSDLLDEAMKMKDITSVPNDISVTNLEIEYGALLSPDYEGRVLFYFRNPFDMSKMSEEDRKIYESESPLHKEKLEALKKKILELYPNYVRYYDASYDETKKALTGLDGLMDTIYSDLTRVFDIDYQYLNSLPNYRRAIMNSEVYFESFYKYAHFRDNLMDPINPDSELKEDYYQSDYSDIPCLRVVVGPSGSGRKTTIACLYMIAKMNNSDYVLPFVFGLDKFTNSKEALIETLISFYEEKLNYRRFKSKNIYTLADLIKYNDTHDKHHFQIFIMNQHRDITLFLKELELQIEEMYHTTFYVSGDEIYEDDYSPSLAFFHHTDIIRLEELDNKEKKAIIARICESKRKELSSSVINAIIKKEGSGLPLYLSLIVDRLLMLDNDDFAKIRSMGDGMDAINSYMLSLVKELGNDTYSLTKELLDTLARRINYDIIMHIYYLSSHDCFLTIDEYRDFFKACNKEYHELDCSLLYNTISSLFKPIGIYNDISFSFDEATRAAKELSEQYVKNDFYKEYLDFLGDDVTSFIKRLTVLGEIKDVEGFYQTYLAYFTSQNITKDSELILRPFVSLMDSVSNILKEDDTFLEDFTMLAIKDIVENNTPYKGIILSIIFYPFLFSVSTDDDQNRLVNMMWEITKYLLKKLKTKKYASNKNLHLVSGIIDYINYNIKIAEYAYAYDEQFDYEDDAEELSSSFDMNIYDEVIESSGILFIYYSMFNRRAMLGFAIRNFEYENEYKKIANYCKNEVVQRLELDELNKVLMEGDVNAWHYNVLIISLNALFLNLYISKHEATKKEYVQRLNHYLKAGELALQNDFFSMVMTNIYEQYYVEPLFKTFSSLINEEYVDEITKYNLSDWLLIRSREFVAREINTSSYIFTYLDCLSELPKEEIPDRDFLYIYPLLVHHLINHFDGEMWKKTAMLLINNHVLNDIEIDDEFVKLSKIWYFNDPDNNASILIHLVLLLTERHRDYEEDDLILRLYTELYDDYDFENQEAYDKWVDDYVRFIPIGDDIDEEEDE